MRKFILLWLVVFILEHAPWTLMRLCVETLVMRPALVQLTQQDDQYWRALQLEARLVNMGWEIKYQRHLTYAGRALYGATDFSENLISIDEDLHWNDRFAVLAHEGAHTLQPGWLSKEQEELFAESVAALVTRGPLHEHARYMSKYKMSYPFFVFLEWPDVYRAAALLSE